MVKRPGRRPTTSRSSWDEAFALIGAELNALASPDEAIFYTSGRASNEAAFAYQLFARAFGTNNLPDCSNMCHESTSIALAGVDRHRQGHRQHRGRLPRQADHRRRPEPRHQPSADAVRAGDRQEATARRSSRSTRCARPGWSRSRTRRSPSGVVGDGHQAGRPAPADQDQRRPGAVPGASARCWCSGTRSTTTSSTGTPPASSEWKAHVSAVDWEMVAAGHRPDPRADHRAGASCSRDSTRPCSAGRWA